MSWRDQTHRKCPRCKNSKPYDDFRRRSGATAAKENRIGQPYGWCKPCECVRRGESPKVFWQSSVFNIRKRAENKYVEFDLTPDSLLQLCKDQNMKCAITGRNLTFIAGKGRVHTNASVDRIETRGPYTIANIRIVCDYANAMRGDATDEDFLDWCEDVLKTLGRHKPNKGT